MRKLSLCAVAQSNPKHIRNKQASTQNSITEREEAKKNEELVEWMAGWSVGIWYVHTDKLAIVIRFSKSFVVVDFRFSHYSLAWCGLLLLLPFAILIFNFDCINCTIFSISFLCFSNVRNIRMHIVARARARARTHNTHIGRFDRARRCACMLDCWYECAPSSQFRSRSHLSLLGLLHFV